MTPAARVSAAIEVLADIETRRRPAADALKDWGLAHRFAGSGDRAAIAGLLYDALRRKASAAFVMGESTPRAVLLGMLRLERKLDARRDRASLPTAAALRRRRSPMPSARGSTPPSLDGAPPWVAGDYPGMARSALCRDLRRRARRGGCGAGVARAARSARQHAQGDARGGGRRARRSFADADALVAARACASCSPPTPAVRRSMPSRPSSRA